MVDEAVPLLLGSIALVFAFRWLFGGNDNQPNARAGDNRPPTRVRDPAGYPGARNDDDEQLVEQLIAAFPNLPAAIVREELARHGGNLEAATDALLSQSIRFGEAQVKPLPTILDDNSDRSKSPRIATPDIACVEVKKGTEAAKRWEQDKAFRSDILKQRKLAMIQAAQRYQSFRHTHTCIGSIWKRGLSSKVECFNTAMIIGRNGSAKETSRGSQRAASSGGTAA